MISGKASIIVAGLLVLAQGGLSAHAEWTVDPSSDLRFTRTTGVKTDVTALVEPGQPGGVRSLAITEQDGVPCRVFINGKMAEDKCRADRPIIPGYQKITAQIKDGHVARGIKVCTSGGNKVVKGWRLSSSPLTGEKWNPFVRAKDVVSNQVAGCNKWEKWATCNANEALVGLAINFKTDENTRPWPIVGARGLCRKMVWVEPG